MKAEIKTLRRPIVMYGITEDCKMRCKHCYNESGEFKRYTPSNNELLRNTDKLSRYAGAMNFTGGEPFQVEILPELLGLSSANGADNIITTNGLRFLESDAPKFLERIEPHIYMLKIGMMGATPRSNDFVRGKGHFDVAMKGFDLMANYNFVRCAKVSLDKHNMGEVEAFCRLSLDHEVQQLVFGQLVNIGRASTYLADFALDSEDQKKVGEELERVKEKYGDQIKIARHCTLSGLCQDAGHFYTVTPRGSVTPCLMREDLAIGNVSKEDVKDLFDRVDHVRTEVKTHPSMMDLECSVVFQEGHSLAGEYQFA